MDHIPITRNTEKVIDDNGVMKYRSYSSANPIYYKNKHGMFKPIGEDIKDTSSNIGNILLKDQNVISVGTRKDSNPSKYLGMRPDNNQHYGTEQMEFSIKEIIINGDNQDIDLTKNDVLDSTTTDLGNVVVENSRNYLRQLVKSPSNLNDFKITFKIYIRGMYLLNSVNKDGSVNKNNRNRFHFKTLEGRHFIIDVPQLLDENFNTIPSFLDHSMTDNGDGTYTYIKFPTDYQKSEGMPGDVKYIDAIISWSALKDGYISANKEVVTACLSGHPGTGAGASHPITAGTSMADHYLLRNYSSSLNTFQPIGSGFSIYDTSIGLGDLCRVWTVPNFGGFISFPDQYYSHGYLFFDLRPFTGALASSDTFDINVYVSSALSTFGKTFATDPVNTGTNARNGIDDDLVIRPFYNASVGTAKHVTYDYSLQNSSGGGTASDDFISFAGYTTGTSCTHEPWAIATRSFKGGKNTSTETGGNKWITANITNTNVVTWGIFNQQVAYTGADSQYKWLGYTMMAYTDEYDYPTGTIPEDSRKRGYYAGSTYAPYLEINSTNITVISDYGHQESGIFQSHF